MEGQGRLKPFWLKQALDSKLQDRQVNVVGLSPACVIFTESIAPYLLGAVEAVRTMITDETAENAFCRSFTLFSTTLVRTTAGALDCELDS